MKLIEFRGRMLRCSEIWVRHLRKILDKCRRQAVTDNHHRRVQRDVRRWQYARRPRGNHSLAAVVALVRRVAGHRATALHALLILGQRGHAVPKLQHQDRDHGQHQEYRSSNHILTLGGLDRKSTRLNSSHVAISYAVFCLKKKNTNSSINFLVTNTTSSV